MASSKAYMKPVQKDLDLQPVVYLPQGVSVSIVYFHYVVVFFKVI